MPVHFTRRGAPGPDVPYEEDGEKPEEGLEVQAN